MGVVPALWKLHIRQGDHYSAASHTIMYLVTIMTRATKERKCVPERLTEFFSVVRRGTKH